MPTTDIRIDNPIIVFMTKFNMADELVERAKRYGARIVFRHNDEYPPLLRLSDTPPPLLYVVGAPLGNRCYVAVAGTREPSPRGAQLAYELGRELAKRGYSVVTGRARGVDSQAWEGHVASVGKRCAYVKEAIAVA